MNYYLVNYLLLSGKQIIESSLIGIPVFGFADLDKFRKSIIAKEKGCGKEPENVVIKSYRQVSFEEYTTQLGN